MNRSETIEIFKGLADGTRSIDELAEPEYTVLDFDILTMAELYYMTLPAKSHGIFVSNILEPKEIVWERILVDRSLRSHLDPSYLKRDPQQPPKETIHYKDPEKKRVSHFYYSWCQRAISYFPDEKEIETLSLLDAEQLQIFFESKIDELIPIHIANGIPIETNEERKLF